MRRLLALVVLGLLASSTSGKEAAGGKAPQNLLGAWRRTDPGRETLMRFEEGRVTIRRAGRFSVYRARYEDGKAELAARLVRLEVEFVVKGDGLTLHFPRETWRLSRLEDVPPELELSPLPLGEARRIPSKRSSDIRRELVRRGALDQEVRKAFTAGGRPDAAAMRRMREADAGNTAYLTEVITEWGWVDARRFGREAAGAAFLIVQHSGDLRLMQAALPGIEKDVRAGRGDPQEYALLLDRLMVNLGERQRFGTQVAEDESGDPVVLPLETAKKVDRFRKELGLMPLSAYLQLLRRTYGGKLPRISEDD